MWAPYAGFEADPFWAVELWMRPVTPSSCCLIWKWGWHFQASMFQRRERFSILELARRANGTNMETAGKRWHLSQSAQQSYRGSSQMEILEDSKADGRRKWVVGKSRLLLLRLASVSHTAYHCTLQPVSPSASFRPDVD